jgi:dTDP-4-dehydrorhamnose reductase
VSISWLVTGARGQLGSLLVPILAARPDDAVTGWGRAELDLTDERQVRTAVRGWLTGVRDRGDDAVLVNAAAYTDVDGAESDESTAALVNGAAPGWLAEELAGSGRLLHVSTDYVFDGTATTPYPVDAVPAPRSAYGRTKAAGERAVAAAGGNATTVRTAWVYDRTGRNFVTTMARLSAERPTVSVVDDQTGAPTWARDLAAALVDLGEGADALPPVLHYTNSGTATWFEVARAVFEEIGADPDRVQPTTSAQMARPARRPAYSVLDLSAWTAAGLPEPRPWRTALHEALRTYS